MLRTELSPLRTFKNDHAELNNGDANEIHNSRSEVLRKGQEEGQLLRNNVEKITAEQPEAWTAEWYTFGTDLVQLENKEKRRQLRLLHDERFVKTNSGVTE